MAIKYWIGGDTGNENDANTAANWSGGTKPVASDTVRVPYRSTMYAITGGLSSLATGLTAFIVEPGFNKAIGTEDTPLDVDTSRFEFAGSVTSYIDLGTSATDCEINATASARGGARGLYLVGTAIGTIAVNGGSVGVAARAGEVSTVTTARVTGASASVWLGTGVTLTTYDQLGGTNILRCAATTATCGGGVLTTEEIGAITTLNVDGGVCYPNSTGTISTLNVNGGIANFLTSGEARTVTNYKINDGQLIFDPSVLTLTNAPTAADYPVSMLVNRAS